MHSPTAQLSVELDRSSDLYSLWLEGSLCDVELLTSDGTCIQAHRVVLAAASRFFKALFTGAWQPPTPGHAAIGNSGSGLQCCTLSGVDGPSLQLLLQAIYSRRLPLTGEGALEDVASLLAASNYFEVLPVREACCHYLRRQLCLASVAQTLALATAHDCTQLATDAARFFEGHFSQLLGSEHAGSIAALPPDLLRQLLASDGLTIGSELDVARAALLWAGVDPAARAPLLLDLLPAARMQPALLAQEAARCGLVAGGAASFQLMQQQEQRPQQVQQPPEQQQQQAAKRSSVQQGMAGPPFQQQQHQQPQAWQLQCEEELGQAFLQACRQLQTSAAASGDSAAASNELLPSFRPRLSCATGLVMAGGLDDGWRSLRTVELYHPQSDSWQAGPLMPAPCSFAAAAMLGGETYVVEGAAHAPSVLAFQRQQRRWRQCHGLSTPRVNMAVAALDERLYVLGGRAGIGKGAAVLRAVEVYCPAADRWCEAPAMACPRTSLAAAALGGRLYAVGGQDSRSTHASVEVFEPGAGRWVALGTASMQHPRKYLGLAVAGGRLVAVGGMTGARMRLPAAEALDPREGRWSVLPPMSVARSSAGVAALHDCVYVVGGNVGMEINENHAGVEAWVPAAGRWRACAPISHGRSGLSVAPF